MTRKEALRILVAFNNYRRGLIEFDAIGATTTQIGEAIDRAILELSK